MNCFYHPDKPAIGLCKACSKGLCIDCTTDLGHGLACKDKHEPEVESINLIISRNAKIYSSASINSLIAPIFFFFIGALFSSFGYLSKRGIMDLPFMMGVGFMVFAVVLYWRNRAIFNSKA